MWNNGFTSRHLIAGWMAAAGLIVAATLALGGTFVTTTVVLVLCLTPAIIVSVLALSGPPKSVGQILYALETKDRRP